MSRKNNGRGGGFGSDVGRLDFHDFLGRLQDRVKWRNGQKEIAVMAIDRIIDRENLTDKEIKEFREKRKKRDLEDVKQNRRMGFSREPFKPLERRPIFKR